MALEPGGMIPNEVALLRHSDDRTIAIVGPSDRPSETRSSSFVRGGFRVTDPAPTRCVIFVVTLDGRPIP